MEKRITEDYKDETCTWWAVVGMRSFLILILEAAQELSLKSNLLFPHLRLEISISV